MELLVLLLLAVPALAQPADCASVPVGPPMDLDLYVGLTGRTNVPVPGPIAGGLGLTRLPAFGSRCPAPPPPSGDVLRGAPAPRDLLRGNGAGDILDGAPAGEVVVGPGRPVPSVPDAAPP